jgi:glycosyltransferase involved in cell wall biosynthesis
MVAAPLLTHHVLRIAHVVNEPFGPDSANGVQQVVYCLARAQAGIGQAVAVFSRESGVHVLAGGAAAAERDVRSGRRPTDVSIRRWLLRCYLEPDLARDVLAWQPDILHFHSIHIPRNVALADHLGRAGIPYCVTVHGALFREALQRGRVKKAAFDLLFERRYLNDSVFIHAVSPHEFDAVRRRGVGRPVVVVPNGVPPGADAPARRPGALYERYPSLRNRRVFMFIGRLDPWQKGLDLLVEAFAAAELGGAGLVLVGPDWRGSQRALTALAARLGIASQVVFTGPAFGEDRANLFAAADVFVHPSRWEGLSLSVLGAAAACKPSVITRHADPLGALERAGATIVVSASVASLASGLRRAAALRAEDLAGMGLRARQVADGQFSWPSIAGRLVDAYRTALATRAEP